ncbi:MAG: hypothetical protein KC656_26845, partial [Myxococcales bacterium]|nr:hypothetical protein [Myxococcales bacterium]
LEAPADPPPRLDPDIPDHDEAPYDVLADPEITKTSGWMAAQLDLPHASTWDELAHDHVVTLAVMGLNERLAELVRDPGSPFLRLAVGEQRLTPREGAQQVTFTAKEGRALEAFRAALVEVERFRRYGLTAGELERARKARLARFDKLVREAEDSDSTGHADEIVRHALRGEPMMGTVPEAEAGKRIVGAVTLEDVNSFAAGFLPERSRSTFVTLPATEGIEPPTPDALRAVVAEVAGVALDPPADRQTVDALVEPPAPGSVVLRDHRYTGDLGFTGLTLANGTQVWWRRTDFTPGEIEIRARRRGGAAAVSDADRTFAVMRMTDRARYESGLGAHDRAAVAGYLKGRSLSFRVGMGDFETSLGGTTATVDLPVALELAYAFQVEPAFTPEGIAFTRELWRDSIVNAANNPDRRFSDAWTLLLWPDDPRSPPLVPDDVERLTPDRAAVLYDGAMGSPEEWTWVFVGDLPADFEDQVALWLGGIPRDVPGHAWVDRGFHRAPGVRRQVIQGGTADRARYRTELYGRLGDEPDDPAWRASFSAFGDILAVRLRERLREDLGGVYGVSAFASTWDDPYRGWRVRVEFQCDPERVDELEAA